MFKQTISLLSLGVTLLLLLLVLFSSSSSSIIAIEAATIPGSENWRFQLGNIDNVEISPNNTAPFGGLCGFNLDQSALNMMCRLRNTPVPNGKNAGLLLAPTGPTVPMYVSGISCTSSASSFADCNIATFDPSGHACNPRHAIGIDCTGTEVTPAINFYGYFHPKLNLYNDLNLFLFYFKNILSNKLNVKKRRVRVMDIQQNPSTKNLNVTWHILDAADEVTTTRSYAEELLMTGCTPATYATYFGTDLNLTKFAYIFPATPAPPNHAFTGWQFRLRGSAYYVGRLEVKPNPVVGWGTVCGSEFGYIEAELMCEGPLSLISSNPLVMPFMGGGSGHIILWDINCYSRTSFSQCTFKDYLTYGSNTTCAHSEDVGINCYDQMDPPLTNTPGTAAPPFYNGTIIAWNATIDNSSLDFFFSNLALWMECDQSRIQVISIHYPKPGGTNNNNCIIVFRWTDAHAPSPSRDALDYELSSLDELGLEYGLGITHLTNNASAGDLTPTIFQPYDVKIGNGGVTTFMGLAYVRPKNLKNPTNPPAFGTICNGQDGSGDLRAKALCKSANKNLGGGGLIPWYKYKAAATVPIYVSEFYCDEDEYFDNCSITSEVSGSCSHTKDVGVICFQPGQTQTTDAPTDVSVNVVVYNVTLSDPDYSQLPIIMASYINMAYDRFKVIFQEDKKGGTTLRFYFTDPVANEFDPTPRITLDTWFQQISAAGWRNLFKMTAVTWQKQIVTPAPTPVPEGNASTTGFRYKFISVEDDAMPYPEQGLVVVQRPGSDEYGTICLHDFSFVEAFAVCNSLGYPTPNPIFRPLSAVMTDIPLDIRAMPISISHIYCAYISDYDTVDNCSVTLFEQNDFDCTHAQDMVLDCFNNDKKLPSVLFSGFVDNTGGNYSRTNFLKGFPNAFNISESRVVIQSETSVSSVNSVSSPTKTYDWMLVNFTFIDDATVFQIDEPNITIPDPMAPPPPGGSPPSQQQQQSRQGEAQSKSKQQGGMEIGRNVLAVANARARKANAMNGDSGENVVDAQNSPTTTTVDIHDKSAWGGFSYNDFTRPQIAWSGRHFMYAAAAVSIEHEMWLFQPQELLDYFNMFEMRRNTTRPNGQIEKLSSSSSSSGNNNNWKYRLIGQLVDGVSNHTRCQGSDARCYGRLEVQMGEKAPYGTVCSINSTHWTALQACRQFNSKITKALLIPTFRWGRGFIAMSDVHCPRPTSGSSSSTISWEQCSKQLSDHGQKPNKCTHNTDAGILCGTDIAPRLSLPSVFEISFTADAFNQTWFPYQFANFTGVDHQRVVMWDARDTLYHEYWNLDGKPVVKLNLTFADGQEGDFTREDLELFFQMHTNWGLYELYGIVEYTNHGPVPLHANATSVTSYTPRPYNCSAGNQTCPPTTPAPPTVITTWPQTTQSPPQTTITTRASSSPGVSSTTNAPLTSQSPSSTNPSGSSSSSPPSPPITTTTGGGGATTITGVTAATTTTVTGNTVPPTSSKSSTTSISGTTSSSSGSTALPVSSSSSSTSSSAVTGTTNTAISQTTNAAPISSSTTGVTSSGGTSSTTTQSNGTSSPSSTTTTKPHFPVFTKSSFTTTTTTTTTSAAPTKQQFLVNFDIPSSITASKFVSNLANTLNLTSSASNFPTYSIVSSNSTIQTVQVSFVTQQNKKDALHLTSQQKQNLDVLSAASVDSPSSTNSPSNNNNNNNNLPVIVGAVIGAVVLIAIIAFVMKKRAARSANDGKSVHISSQYNASMMADVFDTQNGGEELSEPTLNAHYQAHV